MLLLIQIIMFLSGIYAIFFVKVPSFLVMGYKIEGGMAVLFGILLTFPLIFAFVGNSIIAFLFGDAGPPSKAIFEIIIVVGIILFELMFIRTGGQQVELELRSEVEREIEKLVRTSLAVAILGAPFFHGLIFGPMAIISAKKALKLMDKTGLGVQYRRGAKVARIIANIVIVFWVGIIIITCSLLTFAIS